MMEETEKQEVINNKQRIRDRLLGRHPDLDLEDEEAVYGRIDADYAENVEALKKNTKGLSDLFNSNPKGASFISQWVSGKDPMSALMDIFGDDIREALDDPERREALVEASAAHRARILKSAELDEQASQNLDTSLDALDQASTELGIDDTKSTAKADALELFNSIINDAIV